MAIRVGIIGYGMAGSVFHAPLVESTAGLTLTAVVSSNVEKVRHDYPRVAVVPTLERLLERDDIDLVVVATPNETHYPYAKQAVKADKHVVVDKPFVVHSSEADELIALAHERHVVLSVFQNRRWDNDFLTVRSLLETGVLSKLMTYEAHYDRYRPVVRNRWREEAHPGSGMLYDLGAHLIDQVLVLFGTPHSVFADIRGQREGAVTDDYFHLLLGYGYSQQSVILHSSSFARELPPHFQLYGSKGSFIKYGLDSQEDALKAGKRPGSARWGEDDAAFYGTLNSEIGDLPFHGKVTTLPGHYEAFYQGIVEAIARNVLPPVLPEEARNTIRVIECALQSYKEQRAIPFL